MRNERRIANRVNFARGISVRIMAIDGAWQRDCEMLDVSHTGVLLRFMEDETAPQSKEFLLVLSTVGSAHRRCETVWAKDDKLGAAFIDSDGERKKRGFSKI
jgi:hypothetical protein